MTMRPTPNAVLRLFIHEVVSGPMRSAAINALRSNHTASQIEAAFRHLGLKKLGSGNARDVYDLGDGTVIKAAVGTEGLRQNRIERESMASPCGGADAPVVRATAADPNDVWVIAPKVETVTGARLNRAIRDLVGLPSWEELSYVLDAGLGTFPDDDDLQALVPRHERLYERSDWYRRLFDFVQACSFDPAELHGDNWGLDADGQLVVIDLG